MGVIHLHHTLITVCDALYLRCTYGSASPLPRLQAIPFSSACQFAVAGPGRVADMSTGRHLANRAREHSSNMRARA